MRGIQYVQQRKGIGGVGTLSDAMCRWLLIFDRRDMWIGGAGEVEERDVTF